MRFYWMGKGNNYGDILTPYICRRLGIPCRPAPKRKPQALMVGSIAALAKPGTQVFGSGFIHRKQVACKDAVWRWLRGPLSRRMVLDAGGDAPECYGDAALILPGLIPEARKMHDMGYIPHYVDKSHVNREFTIDLTGGDVEHITRAITSCRRIVSSSLHGVIVAHAYGIPAAWVCWSDALAGDGMKFHDHYGSVGLGAVLSSPDAPVFQLPEKVETRHIHEILQAVSRAETGFRRYFLW